MTIKESKRISRQIVLQILYEADFHTDMSTGNLLEIYNRIVAEFYIEKGITKTQEEYAKFLLEKIADTLVLLNSYIEQNATRHSLDKISIIDRNILRLSLAEIFFGKESGVSSDFAIKEAIGLGDMFGSEKSFGFIVSILKGSLKWKNPPVETHKDKEACKASALVYTVENGVYYYLLLVDHFDKWRIVRTKADTKSDTLEAYVLKMVESIFGLDCWVEDDSIAEYSFKVYIPEEGLVKKNSKIMLLRTVKQDVKEINDETSIIKEVGWFTLEEMRALTMHTDLKRIVLDFAEGQQGLAVGKPKK